MSWTFTMVAAVFLGFDGAALIGLGAWAHRPLLVIIGACLFLSAGAVVWLWRHHQRQISSIAADRQALADEARALKDMLGKGTRP